MQKLTLALIHFRILHKEPRKNRSQLLMMIDEAAHRGAKLIVAPELAISGYAFKSRRDMLPYAETRFGPTLCALADAAKEVS
ncbi:MAG: nitrilase-related carbon-nitrogen hydrolase [Desulfosalsimonadaceae bacterium]